MKGILIIDNEANRLALIRKEIIRRIVERKVGPFLTKDDHEKRKQALCEHDFLAEK